ncbi:uncharacterized protein LOC130138604 [Syzygium oleosum]|uniref:uncharacterized protein LOC130138604 n=1 Tax=Syzygium oleosum TaxID=219896 RepID=UPI0024BBC650|nr:uncharacterized protein LOC130138604 [Syzygium oleosum]
MKADSMDGSLGNLYRSIEDLEYVYYMMPHHKQSLLKPKYPTGVQTSHYGRKVAYDPSAKCPRCDAIMDRRVDFVEVPARESGYVKELVKYAVMDDLVVKPMTTDSRIAMLKDKAAMIVDKFVDFGVNETYPARVSTAERAASTTTTGTPPHAGSYNITTRRMRVPTSESSGVTPNEVESEPTCYCGLQSPILTAKTRKSAGRRFHGCAKFDGPGCCDFFTWVDPKIPDQARDMIVDLLERNQALCEPSQSRCDEVDVSSLLTKMKTQRAKHKRLKEELAQVKKEKMLYQLAFVLCMCCMTALVLCNVKVGGTFLSLS